MSPVEHFRAALEALGFREDPEMDETPERVVEMLTAFLPAPPPPLQLIAAPGSDMVLLRDLPFHSLCAHHLLPFFGTVRVAYVPAEHIVGLGGIPRTLKHLAERPQLQERLADQLVTHLFDSIRPVGLGVRIIARQLCMEMRGARSPGSVEVLRLAGGERERIEAVLLRA